LISHPEEKNINKDIAEVSDTIDQVDITDIKGIFYTIATECTLYTLFH
jgi:hypothetical protein